MASKFIGKRHDNPIYNVWASMRQRCNNPNNPNYEDYGGRGIIHQPSWEKFDAFYADMGESYKEGLQLERIDNNGPYSWTNCTWVPRKVNCNNRRSSRHFTINSTTKTLAQWIEDNTHLKPSTIKQRYYGYGWSIEESLGIKERKRG